MDNKQFKKIIQDCVYQYGFVYQNKNYYYNNDDLIILLNCQKSSYENAYYINFGFWLKEIHENQKLPSVEECDIMGRFRNMMGERVKYTFAPDELNEDSLLTDMKRNVNDSIMPVMENGIRKYFEIYPQAICAAKIALKEYLKKE